MNLQPAQLLFVDAQPEHEDVVRAVARAGYRAGARFVDVRYRDPHVRRALIELAPEETLSDSPKWLLERVAALEGNALVQITGDEEPELFADLDPDRIGRAQPGELIQLALSILDGRRASWTIAASPERRVGDQVFGEPDVERLWEAVGPAVRLDDADPVASWRCRRDASRPAPPQLDALALRLHSGSAGPGTDLTVGLIPDPAGRAAASRRRPASSTCPNLPTEEVFTIAGLAPDGGDGAVDPAPCARRRGRPRPRGAASRRASRGRSAPRAAIEVVPGQLEVDDFRPAGLGEVALVDGASRVGQTGIMFFNTLFDENATCHIAYGSSVEFGAPGWPGLGPDERRARGANVSLVTRTS